MRKIYLKIPLLLGLFFCSAVLFAQDSWKEVSENATGKDLFAKGRYKPEAYKIFQLNEVMMQNALKQAPKLNTVEAGKSSFVITIPNSDGIAERFRAVEFSVMDPALAARYPEIKSYVGQGIDNPASTVYFDFSPRGFHAMIMSADRRTMYIDPVDRDGKYYVVFSRKDVVNYQREFHCLTPATADNSSLDVPAPPSQTGRGADDGKLRTYRLALGSTWEYSQFFLDGTETTDVARKTKVLAAMVTLMVRTNGIYERDFGIHMNLIANNDAVIYLNSATDPWPSNLNGQAVFDNIIGTANYDIGHLVHRVADAEDNNGNAGCIGCVCTPGMKGRAFTAHVEPEGDPFVVDYTTHEMGHQFGGNHTYNVANEGFGAHMEPGSGSTIMGYAGITGSADVQPHSDDYFHAKSIEQITDYIKGTTGGACAVVTTTGNATPVANAGSDYIIPRSTPFALTGTGTDADPGDVLHYTWEQYNPGTATNPIPSTTNTSGPVFRSRYSGTSPTRVFPILSSILDGTNTNTWERLPSVARTLIFRLTVRDNHPGGGNTSDDEMVVSVSGSSGPFVVTAPNTSAVEWPVGTTQTVTWSVNNTNAAPVNCANVKISLSYDGGLTFPVVLAASTPNDGSESVVIPGNTSENARIKVEAVGNIFFDISNADFRIIGPEFTFGTPAAATVSCTQTSSAITLTTGSVLGFNTPVSLSASNVPAGTNVTFSPSPVAPGSSVLVTLNNTNVLTPGATYKILITGTAGPVTKTRELTFNVESQTPPTITAQPQAVSTCQSTSANLSVTATNAVSYQWQVSTNGGTSYTPAPGTNNTATYTVTTPPLTMNGDRYRVQVNGTCSQVITSNAVILTVIAPVVVNQNPANQTICETGNVTFTASGTSSIPVLYQWQVSSNGGNSYTNLTNAGGYSGATTGTLSVSNVTSAMNGNLYRALLSSATCATPAVTTAASLTVNARPTVQLTAAPYTNLLPGQTTTISAAITPAPTGFNITWTRDNDVLPGITGTTYLVDSVEVGDYQVSIINPTTGCNNQSNVLTIGATASTNLFIFPTPNDGRFTVSYYNANGAAGRQTLAIYDSRGQQVYNAQLNVNGPYTLHNINLMGKAKGIYYVVIGDGTGKKITEGKVMIY